MQAWGRWNTCPLLTFCPVLCHFASALAALAKWTAALLRWSPFTDVRTVDRFSSSDLIGKKVDYEGNGKRLP